ncbi:hypothetical protein [Kineosporia sp. NBRC 101731]|uniref:hypothetical protein n=1 Tax=Kineosporia sp. NBRC 101731 TaxID=3032199 RepID=UPI0024A14C50|nr:hypothetical protein [Kineosporia sp. NBRC 101731]GLY28820.1 hypothetical protein Kisp02_21850 [Kineosporia sp. NBRC 101731]
MDAMAAGTPARLKQTFPTTEGAPITQTYRTTASGRVRVVTDSTRDPLGSEGIVTRTCIGPQRSFFVLEFESCTTRRTIHPR